MMSKLAAAFANRGRKEVADPARSTTVGLPGAAPTKRERGMEFTYKSGARPLDGYTIKRGLGWGGFGEVYYAISDGGKEVALKLVQRHLDVELRGVAQCLNLKHPNLIHTFDVRNTPGGEAWIVMEYVAGESLQDRLLAEPNGFERADSLDWLAGIADAIDYLHENGIVHRDLKPGNIFREQSLVKVGDYGLSKFISASRRSGQTQSVGTVHYMAPEVSTGNYGPGVDIYSMAVIAFEMLTGTVPFDGETAGEILMKHLTAEPELDRLPVRYRPVFARALAKDPKERFRSARELLSALEQVCDRPTTPVRLTERKPNRQTAGVKPAQHKSIPANSGVAAGWGELFWSMFLAGLLSTVMPVLVLAINQASNGQAPDLSTYVSLAVETGFACWGLLLFGRYWERARVDRSVRHLQMLFYGLGLGGLALGLDVGLDRGALLPQPLLDGPWTPEAMQQLMPTLLAYASLFALAFAIPDWAHAACATRRYRFSLWLVIWPTAVAVFLSNLFDGADGLWIGGTVGMTATIVQWIAPYQHRWSGQRR